MNEQRFLINGRIFAAHDPGLQEALARIYGTPARPRCLCVAKGVEMYVSKFTDFVMKRMPDTGTEHRPTCPSYELPASESGLGEVLGEAIIERGSAGVELRLDFPLTRRIGRSCAIADPKASGEVTVARKQLSLRGLLYYLWQRAGFNRWYPRMQGKRSYWVLRKFLLQACEEVETKGLRLAERVFIPENFSRDHISKIAQRREAALSILLSPNADVHFKMMIAIGEVKAFTVTTLGYTLVLKHLSECAFFLDHKTRPSALGVVLVTAYMNGSLVVGEEPYVDRGSRALVDPHRSVRVLRTGDRNRLKRPFKLRQRGTSTFSDWMPARKGKDRARPSSATVGGHRRCARSIR
jgi:hypothetical protein